MTCHDVRSLLAEYVSGTMPPADTEAIAAHLSGCPACQQECAGLRAVCRLLDQSAAPAVHVNVPALYQETARREKRRARRRRRTALVALVAASVLLVIAVLPRLELRIEKDQLVLRWGPAPAALVETPVRVEQPLPDERPVAAAHEDRLRRVEELAQALALDLQGLNAKQQGEQQLTAAQLTQLREEVLRLRTGTEQDVTTLTRHLEIILKGKGETP